MKLNFKLISLTIFTILLLGAGCDDSGSSTSCAETETQCISGCTDLQTDPFNCGECENACEEGEVCSGGTCDVSCQAGLTECSGLCVNTDYDPNNC
ncbi:MAG: hypothetical protein JXR95_01280, partial [Deltaproteobacteria bacterium]|nr:hypothetical protein [Deltaproteobacteria bacterium]